MKTFDERFCVKHHGLLPRITRDARLLWYLAGMVWKNLTIGGRVRRRYRDCARRGVPFFIDEPKSGAVPPVRPADPTLAAGERQ